MDPKKSPKANLENKRSLFFEIGMAASLIIMIVVFSSGKTDKAVAAPMVDPRPPVTVEEPPITREPKVESQVQAFVVNPQVLNIVPNHYTIDTRIDLPEFIDNLPEPVTPRPETPATGEEPPFLIVEDMPTFQGGDLAEFRKWVMGKVVYPPVAADNGIQGKVTVSFVIGTDGTLGNIEVLQSPDRSLAEEAVRVLKLSPQWTPGKQRNTAVRVRFNLPLDFVLQ